VLLAAADRSDPDHDGCRELLETARGPLITTELVIAETGWLLGRQLGPTGEAALYRSIADGELLIERRLNTDWQRIAALTEQYADQPLGGVDSSLLAVAERLGLDTIANSRPPALRGRPAEPPACALPRALTPRQRTSAGPATRIVWALDPSQCPNPRSNTAKYANPARRPDPRNRQCFLRFSAFPGPLLRCMACKS
jgi:predicted nucleic acid-binding protein